MVTIGHVAAGEWVLVHAVGSGVGTAALQLATALGARVVGTARTNVIRLLPPYVTPKKAFTEFIQALGDVLGATQEKAA